jgi:hypothetical protein
MRCVFPYYKNDRQLPHTNTACCSFCHKMAENCSFKIKWLEKPEYKCLSQIQNKFKAASCNVCIKDIDISNIGGRVHLKVTFSQQNTLNI